MNELNVFIDFDIIKKSNLDSLYKELDLLIITGKKIYLWSKTVSPSKMKEYCDSITVSPADYSKEIHTKAIGLRIKHKTYKEIADELNIPVRMVGFYTKNDPEKKWKLSDWIIDYHTKDSSVYEKIDYLVDCDKKLVERFQRAGRKATLIEKV